MKRDRREAAFQIRNQYRPMIDKRELFLNKKLRCGGFYELSIQVCPSADMKPIQSYTDFVWSLENVEGPFDDNFNKVPVDIECFGHRGILNIDYYAIPFLTFNIQELDSDEKGFNWFDICFYTEAIEEVFGREYVTWDTKRKYPEPLDRFLFQTANDLYRIYPFELAILDFEVSGLYYFDTLKEDLKEWTPWMFFVGQEKVDQVSDKNRRLITVIG